MADAPSAAAVERGTVRLQALAIATITGINVVWSILIIGCVHHRLHSDGRHARGWCWTDFVQVIVLMGGAL